MDVSHPTYQFILYHTLILVSLLIDGGLQERRATKNKKSMQLKSGIKEAVAQEGRFKSRTHHPRPGHPQAKAQNRLRVLH